MAGGMVFYPKCRNFLADWSIHCLVFLVLWVKVSKSQKEVLLSSISKKTESIFLIYGQNMQMPATVQYVSV